MALANPIKVYTRLEADAYRLSRSQRGENDCSDRWYRAEGAGVPRRNLIRAQKQSIPGRKSLNAKRRIDCGGGEPVLRSRGQAG